MQPLAPLKLIFVFTTPDAEPHAAFYDLFGGIPEVLASNDGQQPELIISPVNKYNQSLHDIVTLWVTYEEKDKISQAVRNIYDKHDPLAAIFQGGLVDSGDTDLTDTGFCLEALRAALPILPDVPAKCITTQKLYTVLKLMGGM